MSDKIKEKWGNFENILLNNNISIIQYHTAEMHIQYNNTITNIL